MDSQNSFDYSGYFGQKRCVLGPSQHARQKVNIHYDCTYCTKVLRAHIELHQFANFLNPKNLIFRTFYVHTTVLEHEASFPQRMRLK